jgi:serine/threonine protein kinase
LVMEFIAGDDLAQIIAEQPGPFPRAQVIAWADQVLDALVYLHTRERQIIHRDIKPHNLKLTANGKIALLDFGLAKAHLGDQTTTQSSHSIFGYTRRYSPLEQIQDQGTSPQSDIYALGATLYYLLTGAAALANSKADPLLGAHQVHPVVGSELSAILQKALALSSSGRFQNAQEFREALRAVGRSELRRLDPSSDPTGVSGVSSLSPSDPFDSYSILKPAETAWVTPKRPWSIPMMICGVAVVSILAFIGSTFISSAPETDRAVTDSVKAAAAGNPNPRESRVERLRPAVSPTPTAVHDPNHGNEKPKRTEKRAGAAPSAPPTPSLGPALRLPAQ